MVPCKKSHEKSMYTYAFHLCCGLIPCMNVNHFMQFPHATARRFQISSQLQTNFIPNLIRFYTLFRTHVTEIFMWSFHSHRALVFKQATIYTSNPQQEESIVLLLSRFFSFSFKKNIPSLVIY